MCPLASVGCVSPCHPLILDPSVFGMPILLKHKADEIDTGAAPLPPQLSPPPPITKCPHPDQEVVSQMHGLLRMGAQWLDALHGDRLAAQDASGVMVAAMLRQQGAMREISVWELEVEDMMREMSRLVDGAGPDM